MMTVITGMQPHDAGDREVTHTHGQASLFRLRAAVWARTVARMVIRPVRIVVTG